MTLLLHAISTPHTPADVPQGLRGQPLLRLDTAGLTTWATRFTEPEKHFGRSDLIEHHDIINRVHEQVEACLPVRFPTWIEDETAVDDELRRRQGELWATLESVRGQCELAVTVLWTAIAPQMAPTLAAMSGTQYLLGRQLALAGSDQRRERATELAAEIERLAGADLVAVRRQVCPSTTVALSSALLAPRARAHELMARLPRTHDGVRILVNGPWPAYTFATVPRQAQDNHRHTEA